MTPTHPKSLHENLEIQGGENVNQDMTSMASKPTSAYNTTISHTDNFGLSDEECLLIQQDYAQIFEEEEKNNNICRMIDKEILQSSAAKEVDSDNNVTNYKVTNYVGCHVKNFYLISELVDILYEYIKQSKILDQTRERALKKDISLFLIKKSFQGYFDLFYINYAHECVFLKKELIKERYSSYMSFISNNFENIKINAIELTNFKIKNEDAPKCYAYGGIDNGFFKLSKNFKHINCFFDLDGHFHKELFELHLSDKSCNCNQFLTFHKCETILTCSITDAKGKITTLPINYEFYKLFSDFCNVRNYQNSVASLFYTFLISHKDCSYRLSTLQFLNTVFYNSPNNISLFEELSANRIIGGPGINGALRDEYKNSLSNILIFANSFTENIYIKSDEFDTRINDIVIKFYEFEDMYISKFKVDNNDNDNDKNILTPKYETINNKRKEFASVLGEWECFDKSSWGDNDLLTAEFVILACKFMNDKFKIHKNASNDLLNYCKKNNEKIYKQDDITHFYNTMTKRVSSLSGKMKLPSLPSRYTRDCKKQNKD